MTSETDKAARLRRLLQEGLAKMALPPHFEVEADEFGFTVHLTPPKPLSFLPITLHPSSIRTSGESMPDSIESRLRDLRRGPSKSELYEVGCSRCGATIGEFEEGFEVPDLCEGCWVKDDPDRMPKHVLEKKLIEYGVRTEDVRGRDEEWLREKLLQLLWGPPR